ncbi:MAG: phosphotransferase [Burkholderiaceae bacterium]|nr:phosphotransferase [Burkholderiaceae bacterium]
MTSIAEDSRLAALRGWLASLEGSCSVAPDTMRAASDDASFRRYFRIDATRAGEPSLIAMDAPPSQEDCRPFVHAARVFAAAGVSVPRVLASDIDRGFLLLDDFGSVTYLTRLREGSGEDALYRDAIAALARLQSASRPGVFPDYDHALLQRELDLYADWYLARHLGIEADAAAQGTLAEAFERLIANNLAQGRVYVHRDYHSRNLMVLEGAANPGILDFQDAVYGPVTYDLVSLLRDAYVAWPEAQQIDWAARYWGAARQQGLPVAADFAAFYRDFEWMGLQRHLKVLGIFARLHHRDGKDRYLPEMPRVLGYVLQVARRYDEFHPLARLIERVEAAGGSPTR